MSTDRPAKGLPEGASKKDRREPGATDPPGARPEDTPVPAPGLVQEPV
ncbi:MAG: hypothetical protein QOF98_1989, partial [Streptomyces sp.]|nr:hypothetical protein [Streptomyces sp.]